MIIDINKIISTQKEHINELKDSNLIYKLNLDDINNK
jgi:hypothetical protein